MNEGRKLFCEYGPVFYRISRFKEKIRRRVSDTMERNRFTAAISDESLPFIWKGHQSFILRELTGVDMQLQHNKAENLRISGKKIDGVLLYPGDIFSFWHLVKVTSKRQGYLKGLVIKHGKLDSGYGGGICQLANLIHYMVLHTPLEVLEIHHHSDALFPDNGRRVPFGTGTSVLYPAVDYRIRNNTNATVQIRIWQDDTFLYGEVRSTEALDKRYRLIEENSHFRNENDIFYRCSEVYRIITDKNTKETHKELVLKNHSKVMYDYSLIPVNEIAKER